MYLLGVVVDEGDRVAQLIIERIYTPEVLEVEVSHNIPLTMRTPLANNLHLGFG